MRSSLQRLWARLGLLLLAGIVCAGCGGASAPSGGTSTPVPIELPSVMTGSVGDVPMVSGPVVAPASGNLAPASVYKTGSADYGIQLGSGSADDFPAGSAYSACGNLRSLRTTLGNVALTDYVLCVLRRVVADELNDDENYYLSLSGEPTPRFSTAKFTLSLDDTSGAITGFELFACNSNSQQQYYVSQTRTGTAISGHNLYVTPNGESMGSARADVDVTYSATVNSSNQYTDKDVTVSYLFGTESADVFHYGRHVYTQSSPSRYGMLLTGGGMSNGTPSTSTSAVAGDLVDYNSDFTLGNYNISLLGMSDGANHIVNYDANGAQSVDYTQGWSWDGSRMAPDDGNSDIAVVQAMTLPAQIAGSAISVAFGSGQTWDCSIPSSTASDHQFSGSTNSFDLSQCDALLDLYDAPSLECESLDLEL